MTQNNPMMVMLQSRIRQAVEQDPQARQMAEIVRGKGPREQQQMFLNMCKERGISPQEFAGRFGIRI